MSDYENEDYNDYEDNEYDYDDEEREFDYGDEEEDNGYGIDYEEFKETQFRTGFGEAMQRATGFESVRGGVEFTTLIGGGGRTDFAKKQALFQSLDTTYLFNQELKRILDDEIVSLSSAEQHTLIDSVPYLLQLPTKNPLSYVLGYYLYINLSSLTEIRKDEKKYLKTVSQRVSKSTKTSLIQVFRYARFWAHILDGPNDGPKFLYKRITRAIR